MKRRFSIAKALCGAGFKNVEVFSSKEGENTFPEVLIRLPEGSDLSDAAPIALLLHALGSMFEPFSFWIYTPESPEKVFTASSFIGVDGNPDITLDVTEEEIKKIGSILEVDYGK